MVGEIMIGMFIFTAVVGLLASVITMVLVGGCKCDE